MPKYVIHVGPHKTGSTYLQANFTRLRPQLEARGIIFPAQWTEGRNVSQVGLFRRLRGRDTGLAAEFAAFNRSVYNTVLISSEDIADLKAEGLAFFRDAIGDQPVEIVFYCRRWSELLVSGWQELVKHGHVNTFPQFFSACMMNPFASHVVNFAIRLDRFKAVFGADSLRLVSYNHVLEQNIDLFAHFGRTFLGWEDVPTADLGRINISLGPLDTEAIRALHVLSGGDPAEQLTARFLNNRSAFDTGFLFAAMENALQSLRINEDAPGLRLLHQELFREYGSRLVAPRLAQSLFRPKVAELRFVGPNYLLTDGVPEQLRQLYRHLREDAASRQGPVAAASSAR